MTFPKTRWFGAAAALAALVTPSLRASETDINIPDLRSVSFFGGSLSGSTVLMAGLIVCVIGMLFGLMQYIQTKNLPVHASMNSVSHIIWETCKTYLMQQGKFLLALWILIAICIAYYFGGLGGASAGHVAVILFSSVVGILGQLRSRLVRASASTRSPIPAPPLFGPAGKSPRHPRHSASLPA